MRARWYPAAVSRSMTSDSAEREACAGTEGAAAEKTDADMAAGGERSGRAPVQSDTTSFGRTNDVGVLASGQWRPTLFRGI